LTVSAPDANGPGGGCRVRWVRDAPPIAFRQTPAAIYLVGTAASPVGDDQVSLHVIVEEGARLTLRSVASTIAWASTGSSLSIEVEVRTGGSLDWHLQPLVASRWCNFSQRAAVSLAAGARLRWVEEVVLGRHNEEPGRLELRLDVDVDRKPLLRHQLTVGPGARGWDGPAVLGRQRAVGIVLTAGEANGTGGSVAGEGWAAMPLEGPGLLVQAAAPHLLDLRKALACAVAP
jgi:urease accessory protein